MQQFNAVEDQPSEKSDLKLPRDVALLLRQASSMIVKYLYSEENYQSDRNGAFDNVVSNPGHIEFDGIGTGSFALSYTAFKTR